MSYNGWENYETWNVALWIGNEQYTDEQARELCDGLDKYDAGQELKEFVESMPDVEPVLENASMASDLLGAALSEVNWSSIAEHYIDDLIGSGVDE